QARVLSLFLTGFAVNSIVGSPISGFILDHVHWLGVASWRWLFILEGIPAIALGFLTYSVLPNRPGEAKFLTGEEKEWLRAELEREDQLKLQRGRQSALEGMTNPRVWHLVAIYFAMMIGSYTQNRWPPGAILADLSSLPVPTASLAVISVDLPAPAPLAATPFPRRSKTSLRPDGLATQNR